MLFFFFDLVFFFRVRSTSLFPLDFFFQFLFCSFPVPTSCCLFSLPLLMIFFFCRYNTVHGGWSKWSGWTSCTQSCGTGSQERSRTCTSPPPLYGGNSCLGNPREKQLCNKQPCPGKKRILSHYFFFIRFL